MIHITETLNNYLLENVLTDYEEPIYEDLFPTDTGASICSRYDPSQAKETEYIDGSARGSWSIAYYMRDTDPDVVRETLLKIANGLDNLYIKDAEGTEINVEAQTLPAFVSVDDKNEVVYTINIIARYLRNSR